MRYIIFGPSTNKKGFSNTNAILYDVEDKVTLKFGILPNEENAKWMTVAPEVEISEIIKNEIISDEIVINKKGQSVLLKSNGTWEILSNEGDEGKVVFLIKQATDSHKSYDRKNDLDEFTHYSNYVGCVYNIEVINKTDHKIKINRFSIQTNNKKLFSDRMTRKSMIQYGKIIEPGESYVGKGDMREGGPRQKVDDTKEIATEDQIKKWKSKYGCEAQKGSIFITTPDLGMGPDIAFSDESGITNETKNNFIIGSDKGVYPLLKDIKLH